MTETMMDLKKLLEKEVEKIVSKGDMTPTELDNAKKVVEILCKIDEMDTGYSGTNRMIYPRYWDDYDGYYYDGGRSYDRSYADTFRGGRSYNGDYRGSRSGDGYSGHDSKEKMVQSLRMMMGTAQSDRERSAIADCIDRLTER